MNTLLLRPTDILFFRDGRPMTGSLTGHGAAWPLPTVTNVALHAALHRADLDHCHFHRSGRSSDRLPNGDRNRKFGGLVTAGPFPVRAQGGDWLFPRPGDAQSKGSTKVTLMPIEVQGASSLPKPLVHAVGNTLPPTKDKPETWWTQAAWNSYLSGKATSLDDQFITDNDFSDTEHAIGIGIDPETGTQDGKSFYSAHYLRLRDGWQLGLIAEARDKVNGDPANTRDLIQTLFPNSGAETPVIIGGQQRLCTVKRSNHKSLPLPLGGKIEGCRVKWALLTPAIWPGIGDHSGGWLPSWIDAVTGAVQLLDGPGKNAAKRRRVPEGKIIPAKLVAAIVPKPVPVTGYAFNSPHWDPNIEGGAKSTHLAVAAGAVYYFEAENPEGAQRLADALNWHGSTAGTEIRNRRSTLMGEKGFGLGVCGTWSFHQPGTH